MTYSIQPIPGYPDYYADSDGHILSCKKGLPFRLKSSVPAGKSYLCIEVRNGKCFTLVKVHRLVLAAFKGLRQYPAFEARHLNGNKFDNRPTNLEWGTRQQNYMDRLKHGTVRRNKAGRYY